MMLKKSKQKETILQLTKYVTKVIPIIIALIFFIISVLSAIKYSNYIVDEVHYISASKLILETFFPNIKWNWTYKVPEDYIMNNYLNLEHPPLGKFIIIFSILLLGDNPLAWRLPGIIMGTCIVVLVYYIGKELGGEIVGIIAAIAVLFDPMIRSMSKVAMLDIYLAFFTVLSLYMLIVRNNTILSAFIASLALSVKLNGVIPLLIIFLSLSVLNYGHFIRYDTIYYAISHIKRLPNRVLKAASHILRVLGEFTVIAAIVIVVYLIINIPFIVKYGIKGWIDLQIWMVNVHAHFSASHPAVAPPISFQLPYFNWLFNIKPFGLTNEFSAHVNSYGTPLGAFISLLIPILYIKNRVEKRRILITLWIWFGYIFYVLLYLIGRKMQFIYYLTPITPAIDVAIGLTPIIFDEILQLISAYTKRVRAAYV